ncbi:MAG: hypothetical protein COB67_04375 [SAR324 cluster bacterium]|uniref:prephenate dehydratase n=1 Tax=SAR324 cluster bacterium TaxID=2024889 RepID=A0A2A4T6Z3_9DELT|nr:MAG: hypothetical protein COB67_04375 [SAR324 cluster bacterium]
MNSPANMNLVYPRNCNKVITLGPKGTFSNSAASLVAGDKISNIEYTTTLPEITQAVQDDATALGVIPIENSTSGIVGPAQDSLTELDVVITNELRLKVHYSLISNVPLAEVKQYYSHAVAFNQTGLFTSSNLKHADVIFSNSNIHSGEMFLEKPEEAVAAIIPQPAAHSREEYRDIILADDIQDYQQNITRFVVIQKKPANYFPDFTQEKTSVFIETDEDRHSILFEILREFHVYGINICRLESRPSRRTPWSYGFFIDFYNNHRSATCLKDIQNLGISCEILGTYNFVSKPF